MDTDPAFVRAFGIEHLSLRRAVIKDSAVLQRENIRVNAVPQFVAQRRTEVFDDELLTLLEISAPAAAGSDGKFDFRHSWRPLKK